MAAARDALPPDAGAPDGEAAGVVGVLLAGGRSRRLGRDKRYLVLGGRTLLRRNLDFLRRHFVEVVVVTGPEGVDLGDGDPATVISDAWPDPSPLVGIATALAHVRRPVFVLAADLAFPDGGLVARVLAGLRDGAAAALPRRGRHREPLFAAYTPACLPAMEALLARGEHRIVDALRGLPVADIRVAGTLAFHNINTMAEFREAQRLLRDEADGEAARQPALVAIVGKSDSGKTTLIERLLPELVALGLRVGTVKHDAHDFEIDHPGKDSWRHGQAGAVSYAIASPRRLAFVTRLDGELPLTAIARRFFADCDLVVAEGYKRTAPHRVEVFRRAAGHREPLCRPDEALAVVTDADLPHPHRFALDDAAGLARFLAARLDTLRRY